MALPKAKPGLDCEPLLPRRLSFFSSRNRPGVARSGGSFMYSWFSHISCFTRSPPPPHQSLWWDVSISKHHISHWWDIARPQAPQALNKGDPFPLPYDDQFYLHFLHIFPFPLSCLFAMVPNPASGLHWLVPPFSLYRQRDIRNHCCLLYFWRPEFHQFHAAPSQAGCGKSSLENWLQ